MRITVKAVFVSAFLWTIFAMVYPVCNWITSRRVNVACFYFQWETRLPFLPIFIIPYLSIDLFLIIAPFMARTTQELRIYALRITAATVIAGACFLIFPLKFGWPRPPVDGLLGLIFENFRKMDLPFNQCPSLHIAFLTILLDHYVRNTRGLVRIATVIWFFLILVSTVLTYQHHCLDVAGGLVLGTLCFFLFSDRTESMPDSQSVYDEVLEVN